MGPIQQRVEVAFRYPVHFTSELFSVDNHLLRQTISDDEGAGPRKVLFVIDAGMAVHHPRLWTDIRRYFERHADALSLAGSQNMVDGGEGVKNDPANVALVQAAINRQGLDRHAFVVAVGGGAVLDMAGYAAATAHRGVRFIRVPTTVLSQNDSGVGVKNGINAFGKKNFLGTFVPPHAVLNDSHFLTTLSDRDWRAGISEAVKVALLKDPGFFEFLESNAKALVRRDMQAMRHLIYRCAELHLAHIATSGDPFEFGSSRPLDFGHWAAHKLEQLSDYELRHGEAVAIGIALDSTYSRLAGLLAERDWRRILDLFLALELPIHWLELERHMSGGADSRNLLAGLEEFREHLGGRLTIMLLEGIGRGREVHEMNSGLVVESVSLLSRYQPVRKGAAA
jgi:3-dehydroquinate synthase